jgi:hypothetical protein
VNAAKGANSLNNVEKERREETGTGSHARAIYQSRSRFLHTAPVSASSCCARFNHIRAPLDASAKLQLSPMDSPDQHILRFRNMTVLFGHMAALEDVT